VLTFLPAGFIPQLQIDSHFDQREKSYAPSLFESMVFKDFSHSFEMTVKHNL